MTRWLSCLVLASSAVAFSRAQDELRPHWRPVELPAAAHKLLADCGSRALDLTARRLVDLGPATAEALVGAVIAGEVERSAPQARAIELALRERVADARRTLSAFSKQDATFAEQARALELLAEIGTARDVATALQIARAVEADASELDDTGDTAAPAELLRRALVRLLERAPDAVRELSSTLRDCPQALASGVIEAWADHGRPASLAALADALRGGAWDSVCLLGALGRAARRLAPPFDEFVCSAARAHLDSSDDARTREAALCVGRLGDEDSVERLIELLAHASPGVRANAHWALQRITQREFPLDPAPWRRWIATQSTWWAEQAATLFETIAQGEPAARMAAINAVAGHDWPRHVLARELARSLPANDEAALRLACAIVAQWNSRAAAAELRERLDGADRETRAALIATLERIDPLFDAGALPLRPPAPRAQRPPLEPVRLRTPARGRPLPPAALRR